MVPYSLLGLRSQMAFPSGQPSAWRGASARRRSWNALKPLGRSCDLRRENAVGINGQARDAPTRPIIASLEKRSRIRLVLASYRLRHSANGSSHLCTSVHLDRGFSDHRLVHDCIPAIDLLRLLAHHCHRDRPRHAVALEVPDRGSPEIVRNANDAGRSNGPLPRLVKPAVAETFSHSHAGQMAEHVW